MKKIVTISIAIALTWGIVACIPTGETWYFRSMEVYGAESGNTTTIAGNIMVVFYTTAEEMVLFWCTNAQIIDNGDGTWDVISPQRHAHGVNQALVTYGLYKYQPFTVDPDTPIYLDDLNLEAVTAEDLPKSQHIGKLTAVNVALAKPATVTRIYFGVTYDVQCLVSETIKDMYQVGDLVIGDYVVVSFIEEIPNTTEIGIAIVTDKVFNSWS